MRSSWLCQPSLVLLLLTCFFLANCARQGLSTDQKKIGMHIDAVLEFVIEYPLDWKKDRRVIYGTSNGEVRWTRQTDSGNVMLRVISKKSIIPADISEGQLAEQFPDTSESFHDCETFIFDVSLDAVPFRGGSYWIVTRDNCILLVFQYEATIGG